MGREAGVERGREWESLSLEFLLALLDEIFPFSHQSLSGTCRLLECDFLKIGQQQKNASLN